MHAPSLPTGGPLRILAISGSIALLAFLVSAIVPLIRRAEGARRQALWSVAPLGMALLAFGLGRIAPIAHPVATLAASVVAARNILRFGGTARVLQALGLLTWLIAILAARALFAR